MNTARMILLRMVGCLVGWAPASGETSPADPAPPSRRIEWTRRVGGNSDSKDLPRAKARPRAQDGFVMRLCPVRPEGPQGAPAR